MTPRTFTIHRPTWLRGQRHEVPLLRNTRGMMCCLGHISFQCGVSKEAITGITTPGQLFDKAKVLPPAFIGTLLVEGQMSSVDPLDTLYGETYRHTQVASAMMQFNDDYAITDSEREAELTRLAATIGWTLVFTD